MTCASCAARVEKKLNRMAGVRASVNYATGKATIDAPELVTVDELSAVVSATGYEPLPVVRTDSESIDQDEQTARRLWRRLVVALVLFIPLSDLSIIAALVPGARFPGWQWLLLVMALPVVTWCAWPFHRAAVRNALHRATTMDTLVSAGVTVSTLWSFWTVFFSPAPVIPPGLWAGLAASGSIYLETAAGITVFVLAGRYLEARARSRSGSALRALAQLTAKDACVVLADGSEFRLPVSELKIGQRVIARPGERIAVDGRVLTGSAAVDTSALTGESLPADVVVGTEVLGGTLLLTGRLIVEATAVGEETALAGMVQLVEQAQSDKAAVQRRVDRISSVFVPVVLVVAVLTLIGWLISGASADHAVNAALGVLVIACPCALGLATPTALLVASGRGAQWGIFVKGHQALEASRSIDTVVLDKTGTVTTGALQVVEIRSSPAMANTGLDWLQLAGAVESASEHAVAAPIVRAARANQPIAAPLPPAENFQAMPGLGASAQVSGHDVLVGRPELHTVSAIDPGLISGALELGQAGRTVVMVAVDGNVLGLIGLADTVKESARATVTALHRMGLQTLLLTGDNAGAARTVADAVGITQVRAGVLPAGKVAVIRELQAAGRRVAMVGDGINDGAALATADLAVAIGRGTDVAIQAADIILVREDLGVLVDALTLARETLKTIRWNLRWALGYNVAAVPIAIAGLADPLLASAAMALSSLFVVTNSLRLAKLQPGTIPGTGKGH
jgi:Cu+-exporting ATPase